MNATLIALAMTFGLSSFLVQEPEAKNPDKPEATRQELGKADDAKKQQEQLFAQFEKTLSGVKLIGKFTIIGKEEGQPAEEEYTIYGVRKLPLGDYWEFRAKIKYGKVDTPIAMPLPVKWAGDTPIISLSNLLIPGMGTFSARVVIYEDKYAGTWSHDKVGGHLFGRIEKLSEDELKAEAEKAAAKN